MMLLIRPFLRKAWAYAVVIFLVFSLSTGSFILFHYFQEEKALNLIRATIGSCPYDLVLEPPRSINETPYDKVLEEFFSSSSHFASRYKLLLPKLNLMIPNPSPSQIEKALPSKWSYHIDKVLISYLNELKIRERNETVRFVGNIYIFQDNSLALKALSEAFHINFSGEALLLSDFSYAVLKGILWANGRTVPVSVCGMNSTIYAKVVIISGPAMKAWWWSEDGNTPLDLVMAKTFFLEENNWSTGRGSHGLGIPLPSMAYAVKINGLRFYPQISRYTGEIDHIARYLKMSGWGVYEPKVAAFASAMKGITFLKQFSCFELSMIALLSSFITATVVAMAILTTERKAKMLVRLGIGRVKIIEAYSLLIFVPLGASFLLTQIILEGMHTFPRVIYFCYFLPSTFLSLYFVTLFVARLYGGEEVFWRKAIFTSLYGIIGVIVLGIVVYTGNLAIKEKGFFGSVLGLSLFYYICFFIIAPLLISIGIAFLRNRKGKIVWTKVFKALVPKSFVSAIFFLLVLITSAFSMIAISSGAEDMMAKYLAWKSVGADVVYCGAPQAILHEGKEYAPHVLTFLEQSSMYKLMANGKEESFITINPTELWNYISCKRLPHFIKEPLKEVYIAIKDNSSIVFLGSSLNVPSTKTVNVTLVSMLPGFLTGKKYATLKVKVLENVSFPLWSLHGPLTIIPRKVFLYLSGQNAANYTSRVCYVVFDKKPPLKAIYSMLQGYQIEITREGVEKSIVSRFSSSISVLSISSKAETLVLSALILFVVCFLASAIRKNATALERAGINRRKIVSSYSLGFLAISAGAFLSFLGLSYVTMNLVVRELGALWISPPPMLEIIKYTWPSVVIPPLLALIVGAVIFRRWKGSERNTSEGSEQDIREGALQGSCP